MWAIQEWLNLLKITAYEIFYRPRPHNSFTDFL